MRRPLATTPGEAHRDVLAHRHVVVELDLLERAAESGADPLVGFESAELVAGELGSILMRRAKPLMASRSVVLPAPLGPMSATMLPSATSKLRSSTATTPP